MKIDEFDAEKFTFTVTNIEAHISTKLEGSKAAASDCSFT